MNRNPLIVAIDTSDITEAIRLASAVAPYCFAFKFGLEFFLSQGAHGIHEVLDRVAIVEYVDGGRQHVVPLMPFMLDLKLHDIPSTVAKAVKAILPMRPWALTIHASGGSEMMCAAVEAVAGADTKILAVTILTSSPLNDADAARETYRMAFNAMIVRCDGITCPATEAAAARRALGAGLIVCPGIRPFQDGEIEQRRIATPGMAMRAGANYIVVGRPITRAANPAAAAKAILEEAIRA